MVTTPNAKKVVSKITVDLSKKGYSKTGPEFKAIWENLQGNILKSHGRDHAAHIFFRLNPARITDSRAYLREFSKLVTTAYKAEEQSKNKLLMPNAFFYGLYLTAKGYTALGVQNAMPADERFRKGMKDQDVQDTVADNVADWENTYKYDYDGMILVAQDSAVRKVKNGQTPRPKTLAAKAAELITSLQQIGASAAVEYGDQVFNIHKTGPKKGEKLDGIENFGYVDGISQPKFFKEDTPDPNAITQWDPSMPWDLVLVPDTGTAVKNCLGSYFVFRKLEQNVAAFKASEEELGESLLAAYKNKRPHEVLTDEAEDRIKELAGAMVVGRWEDGMPVKVSDDPDFTRADHPHGIPGHAVDPTLVGKINNFNYNSDNLAAKCPFHAHIRKTNPRGESAKFLSQFGVTFEQERRHTMARRGITYGIRPDDPNAEIEPADRPTGGVGLLFMSFQSDVSNQFEFIQSAWVNNGDFVKPGTGIDPIIGQGGAGNTMADGNYSYPAVYNDATSHFKPQSATNNSGDPFKPFVTMKGGDYFYAPSISFLAGL